MRLHPLGSFPKFQSFFLLHDLPSSWPCLTRENSGNPWRDGIGIDPYLYGASPPSTAQTSLPSWVSTATARLPYPVSCVRIPSPVHSIPIPIATPTPSLLRPLPFRMASVEKYPATEITENTEAKIFSHLKSTRMKSGPSRRWQKEKSLCELCALCG